MISIEKMSNSLKLQLADIERTSERRVYSLIQLMSDFGGFNDGLNILPAILMAVYNSRMYHAAWASFFPVKERQKKSANSLKHSSNPVIDKYASKQALG